MLIEANVAAHRSRAWTVWRISEEPITERTLYVHGLFAAMGESRLFDSIADLA